MNSRIVDAILEAYTAGSTHLPPDMPDDMNVSLLVRGLKLGDLRELELSRERAATLGSGVPGDEL